MAKITLSKSQQQILAAAVVGLGAFGYVYAAFFWLPISQKIKETNHKIEEVEAQIEKATRQAARLPRLEAEIVQLNQAAIEAEKRLPKKKSVPDILVTVSALAAKHHVALQNFSPGGQKSQQFFIEWSYPVTVKGTFHNIGKFLAAVALEERIFNVQSVVYSGASEETGEMSVSFTLLSYQYKG